MKPLVRLFPFLILALSSCVGNFNKAQAYFSNGQYEKALRETNRLLFLNNSDIQVLDMKHLQKEQFV